MKEKKECRFIDIPFSTVFNSQFIEFSGSHFAIQGYLLINTVIAICTFGITHSFLICYRNREFDAVDGSCANFPRSFFYENDF